ncbi:MAG: TolC family protein [Campylobacterales bacterium]|nr:TolC family protein [Campylobacterales bacterium]
MKILSLILLVPLFGFASGNLSELLNLAEQNHYVQSSRYQLESAQENARAVRSGYLPSLSLGANQTYNKEENMLTPEESRTGSATLSFTLYDGGKRGAQFSQQDALVKSATFALSSVQNSVSLDVIYAYFNYLSTLASLEATEQKKEQLLAERYRLERFLSVEVATEDELQKIISTIEQTNVDLLTLKNTLNNLLNTLEYLTGERVTVTQGSRVVLKETQEGERFDILALEQNVHSVKEEAKIAKSAHLPTITLEDTYSRFKYDYANSAWKSDKDDQNTVQLSLRWNIFDFGATAATVQAAQKNYLAKSSELAYEKHRAKASYQSARNSYQTALAKIEANKAKLHASQTTYALVKKKFQQGIVNNVTYLDALSDRFNAQAQLQTALNEVEYQKAVLLYEMGEEIKGAIQ